MCICRDTPLISIPSQCIYNTSELFSFLSGFVSLICFIVALFPQIYLNYTSKSVHGLSLSLILIWTVGDVTNLLGTVFANQLLTQKLTALYFVLIDALFLSQFLYYEYLYPTKLNIPDSERILVDHVEDEAVGQVTTSTVIPPKTFYSIVAATVIVPICLFIVSLLAYRQDLSLFSHLTYCDDLPSQPPSFHTFGSVMAWCSGLFYITSRIPQIIHNYCQQSTTGLSAYLFILTITANITYALSIFLKGIVVNEEFWSDTFPFLLGSLGTLVFDCTILIQHYFYSRKSIQLRDEDE